jgi:hypothetical protein
MENNMDGTKLQYLGQKFNKRKKTEPDARLLALSGSLRFRRSLPGHQKLVLLYT